MLNKTPNLTSPSLQPPAPQLLFPASSSCWKKSSPPRQKPPTRNGWRHFAAKSFARTARRARLRPEARSVRFGCRAIHEITALTVSQAREFFSAIEASVNGSQPPAPSLSSLGTPISADDLPIFQPLAAEIQSRLAFLQQVGLNYLTLDRPADTLSGGELQRVRLATSIGSGLVGVCYVLDEPSIGLHPRDNQRLIDALRDLQSQGNTVLVVEHDADMMRQADDLLDLGPGAGAHGGRIVSHGTPAAVAADPNSLTGRYLSGAVSIPVPPQRRRGAKTRSLTLEGVTTNNLKNVSVRIPLGVFTCVTGVSGSGKSSLVNETLARALVRRIIGVGSKPGPHTSLRGVNQIDKIIVIDQAPIGRSPRSNPATYVGIFDEIRKVFASTPLAKQRGYTAGRFSFNVAATGSAGASDHTSATDKTSAAELRTSGKLGRPKKSAVLAKGGRCEECQGYGVKKIEMQFLPDLFVTCPVCHGQRFNRQTLEVKFKDMSIADVLALRIDEAAGVFENFPLIARPLASLHQVGLGYLTLGQSATTLSGGEAQRVKLAAELARVETGSTLYLLDEPTTGLHFDDVRKLLDVLQKLVDLGNTVLVIEHNLDVMKSADWLIDLGPEGGEAGGHIIAEGTPEEVAALADNPTGRLLKPLLNHAS